MKIKFCVGYSQVQMSEICSLMDLEYETLDLSPERMKELIEVFFADFPLPLDMDDVTFLTNKAVVANLKSGEKLSVQWIENWIREQHIKKQEERKKKKNGR